MMEEKLKIPYPILVEGKYDRVRLLDVVDSSAQIIKTDGFGIFNHSETAALIRALAQKSRLIVLTDSDGAGKLIRSRISNLVPRDRLIQLYIPQIQGKEKRKAAPSKVWMWAFWCRIITSPRTPFMRCSTNSSSRR